MQEERSVSLWFIHDGHDGRIKDQYYKTVSKPKREYKIPKVNKSS